MERRSYSLNHLTDCELEAELHRIVNQQRVGLADLLCHLGEVDARKLYLGHACSCLFTYCTTRLGFSESEAFKRTQAARLARSYPVIFTMVAEGRLHLSAINLLAPRLAADNHLELLEVASGKSKRALEELLAARWPRPDAPTRLRKEPDAQRTLPAGPSLFAQPCSAQSAPPLAQDVPPQACLATSASAPAPTSEPPSATPPARAPWALSAPSASQPKRPVLEPLSEDRYRLQVTLSRQARDTLLRLQALMRHSIPDGDLSLILEKALAELCDKVEARRLGKRRGRRSARVSTPTPHQDGGAVEIEAIRVSGGAGVSTNANADPTATATTAATAPGPKCTPAAAPGQPTPAAKKRSRHVSNEVRRDVIAREGCRCSFVDAHGNRCQEEGFLQFHHRTAFARGGAASAGQMTLLCHAHHAAQTELDFGAPHVRAKIAARRKGAVGDSTAAAPGQPAVASRSNS